MNRLNKLRATGGAVLVAACLAVPSTASAASPLKGWWPMNERSGQTVRDWSGNGNHGMLGSTPVADDNDPTWIKGIFNVGSALRFARRRLRDDPRLAVAAAGAADRHRPGCGRSRRRRGRSSTSSSKGGDELRGRLVRALHDAGRRRLAFYVYRRRPRVGSRARGAGRRLGRSLAPRRRHVRRRDGAAVHRRPGGRERVRRPTWRSSTTSRRRGHVRSVPTRAAARCIWSATSTA